MSRWIKTDLCIRNPDEGDREIELRLNVLPGYPASRLDPGCGPEIDILEAFYTDDGSQVPQAVIDKLDLDHVAELLEAA